MNLTFIEKSVVKAKLKDALSKNFAQGAYLEIDEKTGELQITLCKSSPFVKLMEANNHISELIKKSNGKL